MTELSKDKKQQIELSGEQLGGLIDRHIGKMWGGLEMASIQYFIETGKITGSFRLRLISLMKFYQWKHEELNAAAEATKALILIEALEKIINEISIDQIDLLKIEQLAADALKKYNQEK